MLLIYTVLVLIFCGVKFGHEAIIALLIAGLITNIFEKLNKGE